MSVQGDSTGERPPLDIPVFVGPEDLAAEIFRSTDSSTFRPRDPESLKKFADEANEHVTAMIKRYSDTVPVKRGSDMFRSMGRIALLYGCLRYYRSIGQRVYADQYAVSYKEAVEAVQDYLRTEPTGRQAGFSFGVTDRASERMIPYSQVGLAGDPEVLY